FTDVPSNWLDEPFSQKFTLNAAKFKCNIYRFHAFFHDVPSLESSRTIPRPLRVSRILSDKAHIFCFLISFRTSMITSINPASADPLPETTVDDPLIGSPRIPEPNSSNKLSISRSVASVGNI